jgi:hypothetical protein
MSKAHPIISSNRLDILHIIKNTYHISQYTKVVVCASLYNLQFQIQHCYKNKSFPLYGSDIWDFSKNNDCLETVHLRFSTRSLR